MRMLCRTAQVHVAQTYTLYVTWHTCAQVCVAQAYTVYVIRHTCAQVYVAQTYTLYVIRHTCAQVYVAQTLRSEAFGSANNLNVARDWSDRVQYSSTVYVGVVW